MVLTSTPSTRAASDFLFPTSFKSSQDQIDFGLLPGLACRGSIYALLHIGRQMRRFDPAPFWARMTARSRMFRSSRTFPGQEYCRNEFNRAFARRFHLGLKLQSNLRTKYCTSRWMSGLRSRKAGK